MYWTDFKRIKLFRQKIQRITFLGQIQNGSFVTMETVTFMGVGDSAIGAAMAEPLFCES